MRTVAVLPVKRFGRAKRRLAGALSVEGRGVLAEAMVRDVLLALARAQHVERTLVVTSEPRALALAPLLGAEVVKEGSERGHSGAARLGVERALALGAERALLVPGDCPTIDAGELDALLANHHGRGVVVVPDRHGSGTNALLLSPPEAIEPAFGPDSRERHVRLAERADLPVTVARVESLAYDVDTADDLAVLRAQLQRRDARTGTRGVLAALDRGERVAFAGG
jgi:2-phospho-L-lactate guanylyltransferase